MSSAEMTVVEILMMLGVFCIVQNIFLWKGRSIRSLFDRLEYPGGIALPSVTDERWRASDTLGGLCLGDVKFGCRIDAHGQVWIGGTRLLAHERSQRRYVDAVKRHYQRRLAAASIYSDREDGGGEA